jgi:hypothetical protein
MRMAWVCALDGINMRVCLLSRQHEQENDNVYNGRTMITCMRICRSQTKANQRENEQIYLKLIRLQFTDSSLQAENM